MTTETSKLKISTTVQVYDTVNLEIDLPYYCKTPDANTYFKVVSNDRALQISKAGYGFMMIANPQHSHTAREIAQCISASEEEFNDLRETILSLIQKTFS